MGLLHSPRRGSCPCLLYITILSCFYFHYMQVSIPAAWTVLHWTNIFCYLLFPARSTRTTTCCTHLHPCLLPCLPLPAAACMPAAHLLLQAPTCAAVSPAPAGLLCCLRLLPFTRLLLPAAASWNILLCHPHHTCLPCHEQNTLLVCCGPTFAVSTAFPTCSETQQHRQTQPRRRQPSAFVTDLNILVFVHTCTLPAGEQALV